jgi:hypothetical protein
MARFFQCGPFLCASRKPGSPKKFFFLNQLLFGDSIDTLLYEEGLEHYVIILRRQVRHFVQYHEQYGGHTRPIAF